MSIWKSPIDLEQLTRWNAGTAAAHLGIEFTAAGDDWLEARMAVDHRTFQPFHVLHGGASVLLAETVASCASNLCLDGKTQHSVGQEINANHVRSVAGGHVTGRATAVHLGRNSHVWEIRIVDDEKRLICISRITMAVLTRA